MAMYLCMFTCLDALARSNKVQLIMHYYLVILHFLIILCHNGTVALSENSVFQSDESSQHIVLTANLSRLYMYFIIRLTWQINDTKIIFSLFFFKRSALSHMRPMSLSLTSPDRPVSLSHNVLEEIENFLHSVAR